MQHRQVQPSPPRVCKPPNVEYFQNSQEISAQLPVWNCMSQVCHLFATGERNLIGLIPAGRLSRPALEPAIGHTLGP